MKSFITPFAFLGCLAIEKGMTSYLLVEVEEGGGKTSPNEEVLLPGPLPEPLDLDGPKKPNPLNERDPLAPNPMSNLGKQSFLSCCKENGVTGHCLGLCMGYESVSSLQFSSRWVSACKRFDSIYETCFTKYTDVTGSIPSKGILIRVNKDILLIQILIQLFNLAK